MAFELVSLERVDGQLDLHLTSGMWFEFTSCDVKSHWNRKQFLLGGMHVTSYDGTMIDTKSHYTCRQTTHTMLQRKMAIWILDKQTKKQQKSKLFPRVLVGAALVRRYHFVSFSVSQTGSRRLRLDAKLWLLPVFVLFIHFFFFLSSFSLSAILCKFSRAYLLPSTDSNAIHITFLFSVSAASILYFF